MRDGNENLYFFALFAALIAWFFTMDITIVDISIMAAIVAAMFLVSVSYDVRYSDLKSILIKNKE